MCKFAAQLSKKEKRHTFRHMNFYGLLIAIATFSIIGIFHPLVIKTEYYFGTRPWIVYLMVGIASITASVLVHNEALSIIFGVFGASALWGIGELFQQRQRVLKGWFPKNPKRADEYDN